MEGETKLRYNRLRKKRRSLKCILPIDFGEDINAEYQVTNGFCSESGKRAFSIKNQHVPVTSCILNQTI